MADSDIIVSLHLFIPFISMEWKACSLNSTLLQRAPLKRHSNFLCPFQNIKSVKYIGLANQNMA